MRYLQSEVDPYQTEIVSDFRSAKELMDLMQKTVEQIILQCDGADEFRSQFRNLVSSFKQVLDDVESQFVELMNKDREQIEKAEKLNTTKVTISRYENNLREPKREAISQLAKLFNVSTDYLHGHTNDKFTLTKEDKIDIKNSLEGNTKQIAETIKKELNSDAEYSSLFSANKRKAFLEINKLISLMMERRRMLLKYMQI